MDALAQENSSLAELIEMRYFGGMTAEETAASASAVFSSITTGAQAVTFLPLSGFAFEPGRRLALAESRALGAVQYRAFASVFRNPRGPM